METPEQIQFTAVVVTLNEEKYLAACLKQLAFCNELIVIDLGSTDRSVQIAQQHHAQVIPHERVPVVEYLRQKALDLAKNDWVILIDPDEVMPEGLADDLRALIFREPTVGAIKIKNQYFFKGKPLYTTRWGVVQFNLFVFHRKRVTLSTYVHGNRRILPGYDVVKLKQNVPNYYAKHYWADSYRQLFEKHARYIQHEGEARYHSGLRFSWIGMLFDILKHLVKNLFQYKGIFGGFRGIFLSFFYAWYVMQSWLSLRHYQQNKGT